MDRVRCPEKRLTSKRLLETKEETRIVAPRPIHRVRHGDRHESANMNQRCIQEALRKRKERRRREEGEGGREGK